MIGFVVMTVCGSLSGSAIAALMDRQWLLGSWFALNACALLAVRIALP